MTPAEPFDRRALLAAAAASVVAASADTATAAPDQTVTGTYTDRKLTFFRGTRRSKRPVDGFNQALIDAVAKLPLKPGERLVVKNVQLAAHAVYAKDPGAFDEYLVTLTY